MIRLTVVALLIAACASPAPTPSPTPPPSASPTPPPVPTSTHAEYRRLPRTGTQLEPGRYFENFANLLIQFEVGPGWTTVQQLGGFFDIQDEPGSLDVVAVQFATVPGEYDEIVEQVMNQANTQIVESDDSSIGGIDGIVVVVETIDPPDTQPPLFRPVLNTAAGPISIASGRRLWISLLPVGDGVIAVMVGGSIAAWDYALELAEPVLKSVVIAEVTL
jgi:hypothetical protein